MSCNTNVSGVGVGLYGETLGGSALFVVDTRHMDSLIKTASYLSNDFDPLSASLKCSYMVSNYLCDLNDPYYFTEIAPNPLDVGISGRYVAFLVEISRVSAEVYSPRVWDMTVDFSYPQKEYDYRTIYKMKSDIFGFEYALLKDSVDLDQYNYKFLSGQIYAKTLSDKVVTLSSLIPSSYTKYQQHSAIYPDLYEQMLSGILDFELFYDTFLFVTSSYLVFEKTLFNYEENEFSLDDAGFRVLNLSESGLVYSDVWFFENQNEVLVFLMGTQTVEEGVYYPQLKCYKVGIKNGQFKELTVNHQEALSGITFARFEIPVVTYDAIRSDFNVSMVFYGEENDFNIMSCNLNYDFTTLDMDAVNIIKPVDYSGT